MPKKQKPIDDSSQELQKIQQWIQRFKKWKIQKQKRNEKGLPHL